MRVLIVYFLLAIVLVGCSHDISQCSPYYDVLNHLQDLILQWNSISYLNFYATIWAIIIVRKIFYA
jgi:hypothetical protein